MSTPTPSQRIEGLSTWRALLMVGGVLLHATMGEEQRPAFAAINIISGSFRMGAFFMISGLLSGFAVRRRADPATWLRARLLQLGIPTLFGIAVICPLIAVLLAMGVNAGQPWQPNVYHLWFMVALLLYTCTAYVAQVIDQRWGVFARIERRAVAAPLAQPVLLVALGALCFVLMVWTMQLTDRWVPAHLWPLLSQTRLVVGYLPLFLFGFTLARAPTLLARMTNGIALPVAILVMAAAAHIWWESAYLPILSSGARDWGNDMLLAGSAAWCPPAAAVLILRSAMAIRRVPPLVARLSDASFTMYIVHYPIIVAVKLITVRLMLGPWAGYTIAVVAGGTLAYAFHVAVVRRSPVLTLLFNGRAATAPAPVTVRERITLA